MRTAILSNGSPKMLDAVVKAAKLDTLLDAVLSVEAVGVYKPHPKVYQLAIDRLGVPASAISFQSSRCSASPSRASPTSACRSANDKNPARIINQDESMFPTPSSTSRVHTKSGNNREKNREFRQIRPLCKILKTDTRANSKASSEIPYAKEQGIISAENREFWFRTRGFFWSNPKSSPDEVFGTHN